MILGRKHPKRKPAAEKKVFSKQRNGKRKKTINPKGIAIRISEEVHSVLYKKQRQGESWDHFFRRVFNLPQRTGEQSELLFETWVLPSTGQTAKTKALARGVSLHNGVSKGHAGRFEEPKKVREIV